MNDVKDWMGFKIQVLSQICAEIKSIDDAEIRGYLDSILCSAINSAENLLKIQFLSQIRDEIENINDEEIRGYFDSMLPSAKNDAEAAHIAYMKGPPPTSTKLKSE